MAQGLTHPAGEPESAVLADSARLVRWVGPAFVLFSVVMVPWTVYLGYSLPSRQRSPHYDIAWVGFDVMLMVVLASTGWFALRRSRYLAAAAAATATILIVDAWFDIITSPRRQRAVARRSRFTIPTPGNGQTGVAQFGPQRCG